MTDSNKLADMIGPRESARLLKELARGASRDAGLTYLGSAATS